MCLSGPLRWMNNYFSCWWSNQPATHRGEKWNHHAANVSSQWFPSSPKFPNITTTRPVDKSPCSDSQALGRSTKWWQLGYLGWCLKAIQLWWTFYSIVAVQYMYCMSICISSTPGRQAGTGKLHSGTVQRLMVFFQSWTGWSVLEVALSVMTCTKQQLRIGCSKVRYTKIDEP